MNTSSAHFNSIDKMFGGIKTKKVPPKATGWKSVTKLRYHQISGRQYVNHWTTKKLNKLIYNLLNEKYSMITQKPKQKRRGKRSWNGSWKRKKIKKPSRTTVSSFSLPSSGNCCSLASDLSREEKARQWSSRRERKRCNRAKWKAKGFKNRGFYCHFPGFPRAPKSQPL